MANPAYDDEALRLLIPDYLNGNLDPVQRAKVQACLDRNENARQELAFWHDMMSEVDRHKVLNQESEPAGLQEFLAYTRAHPIAQVTGAVDKQSWWVSFLQPSARWMKAGLAFSLLVIAGQGALLLRLNDTDVIGASEQMRGIAPAHAAKFDVLTISFKPDATERNIRQALMASAARIIDGPSGQMGDYQIAVPVGKAEEAAKILKESGLTLAVVIEPTH